MLIYRWCITSIIQGELWNEIIVLSWFDDLFFNTMCMWKLCLSMYYTILLFHKWFLIVFFLFYVKIRHLFPLLISFDFWRIIAMVNRWIFLLNMLNDLILNCHLSTEDACSLFVYKCVCLYMYIKYSVCVYNQGQSNWIMKLFVDLINTLYR